MASIEERVRDLVVEQLGVSEDQVNPQASFIDDLGADSLDTVELVMAFEEEFGIDIPDEDAEKMSSVGDAIKYLEETANLRQEYIRGIEAQSCSYWIGCIGPQW